MTGSNIFLAVLFLLGSLLNLFLIFKIKRSKPPVQETYDVKELLHDLSAGEAIVRISRVAPADVFLRSPRDRR